MAPPLSRACQRLAFRPAPARPLLRAAAAATCSNAAATRPFSSSPAPRSQIEVPPESPKYITIPQPRQTVPKPVIRNRGHLPVPRTVFEMGHRRKKWGRRAVDPRLQPETHVESVMPLSQAELKGRGTPDDYVQHKRKLTNDRRQALLQGLDGLRKRAEWRYTSEKKEAARQKTQRKEALMAPERPDELLTRPTVRASTLETRVIADPERFAKAEESRLRTAEVFRVKSEARMDNLQMLYMSARDFIINEKQLHEKIAAAFKDDAFALQGSMTSQPAQSMWDTVGAPMNVRDLVKQINQAGTKSSTAVDSSNRANRRQKLVAEELTGGKL